MRKLTLILSLVLYLTALSTNQADAQIVVSDTMTPTELANTLAGKGVTISNVNSACPDSGMGVFNAVNSNININNGVVLTSGSINNVVGPNNNPGSSVGNASAGDADLNVLASPDLTEDACILEFDVTVQGDSLSFEFVFGSEEYLEWVNSGFNDVFGFFISGPGIVGPFSSPIGFPNGAVNIALVPGTVTPITINNINNVTNPGFYIDNGTGNCFAPPFDPQCTDTTVVQYDGFTVVMTASIGGLIPCSTYHLKLAVADAGDDQLDSGIFLKAGSITASNIEVSTTTSIGNVFLNAVEECSVDGVFRFVLETEAITDVVIHYQLGGDAINGVDYSMIPDSVVINAGDTIATITIDALADGITEGLESVKILLMNPCTGQPYDSAVIFIQDNMELTAIAATDTICEFNPVQLNASGAAVYLWSPGGSLSNSNIADPIANPNNTTTYQVIGILGACTDTQQVQVVVSDEFLFIDAGSDDSTCLNGIVNIDLDVNGNGSGYTYSWMPIDGLSDPTTQDPAASPTQTLTYTVQVASSTGCIREDSMTVVVIGIAPMVEVMADPLTLCAGDTVDLTANVVASFCNADATPVSGNPGLSSVGTGTTASGNPSPYGGFFEDGRIQMMYRASELQAAGISNSRITDIVYNVLTKQSTIPYDNFTISMGCTDDTELSGFLTGLEVVKFPHSYTTFSGFNTHNLDIPYEWDGVSNLVIEICFDNSQFTQDDQVATTATTFNSVVNEVQDFAAGCSLNNFPTAGTARPNIQFIHFAKPAPVLTYTWSPQGSILASDSTNATAFVSNTTIFQLDVDNGFCAGADQVEVEVDSLFTVIAIPDTVLCEEGNVQLFASIVGRSDNGFTFDWTPTTDLTSPTAQDPSAQNVSTTINYQVVATSPFGCVEMDDVTLTYSGFDLTAWFSDTTIERGEQILIGADVTGSGSGNYNITWTPIDDLGTPTGSLSTTTQPLEDRSYLLIVEDRQSGCIDSAVVNVFLIIPDETVVIPDAFTPNDDALNDVFRPLFTNPNLVVTTFQIYNRWGKVLGEDVAGWDGYYNGKEQPVGTYVYYLVIENDLGEQQIFQGPFSLIR